jgi:hypothetical protein
MIGMMYGGEITDRAVKHVLSQLKKQQAAIKIGKQPTRICDLRDWPDKKVTDAEIKDYLLKSFKINPHLYRPVKDVWGEITTRFATTTRPRPAAQPGGEPVRPQKHTSARPAQKRGNDGNPNVEAGAVDERPAAKPPRQLPRKTGVLPKFVHESPQDAESVERGGVETDRPKEE